MADRSRRGLSFFPVLWAALRMSDSIAARGRVVGGYGLLFASQPPYVRAAVLFTDASAEPITAAVLCPRSGFGIRDPRFYCFESRVRIAGRGAGLQPDQIRSRYVDDGQALLDYDPLPDRDWRTSAYRIRAHHVHPYRHALLREMKAGNQC